MLPARFSRSRDAHLLQKRLCCCCGARGQGAAAELAVIVGQHVFVDSTNGNDATGLRERLDRPFQTLPAAFAVAQSGDTVALQPGDYPLSGATELPNVAALTIEGWGGRQEIRISSPDSVALRITAGQVYQRLTLRSLALVSAVDGSTLLLVNAPAAQFAVGGGLNGLQVHDVQGGAIQVFNAGYVHIRDSDLRGSLATTLLAATSYAELVDVRCDILELYYLDDLFFVAQNPGPLGRLGYHFSNVASETLFGSGTLLCAFDEACRFGPFAAFTTINSTAFQLDASLQFQSKFGGTTNSLENGLIEVDDPPDFSTYSLFIYHLGTDNDNLPRPWQNTGGDGYRSGFDVSGATFYDPFILLIQDLPIDTLPPKVFFFGGSGTQFLSSVLFYPFYPTLVKDQNYPFQLSFCEFGCPTLPEATAVDENVYLVSADADINARGTNQRLLRYWEAGTLSPAPPYSFTVDRDTITFNVDLAGTPAIDVVPIEPALPASAVGGIFVTPGSRTVGMAVTTVAATDSSVSLVGSTAGNTDLLLSRYAQLCPSHSSAFTPR